MTLADLRQSDIGQSVLPGELPHRRAPDLSIQFFALNLDDGGLLWHDDLASDLGDPKSSLYGWSSLSRPRVLGGITNAVDGVRSARRW